MGLRLAADFRIPCIAPMLSSVVEDSRAERSQLAGRTSLLALLGTSDSSTNAREMEARKNRSMVHASSLAQTRHKSDTSPY